MVTNYSSKLHLSLILSLVQVTALSETINGQQILDADYNIFQRILYKQMVQPDYGCTVDYRRDKETDKNKERE